MILPVTLQVADAAYLSGKYAISADLFTDLTAEGNTPETMAKGLAGLGWCRLKLNDYEAADRVFSQFLERYPDRSQRRRRRFGSRPGFGTLGPGFGRRQRVSAGAGALSQRPATAGHFGRRRASARSLG